MTVRSYLDLSASHLTEATADRIWSGKDAPVTVWPDPHPHDAASCFVYVPSAEFGPVENCPPDLARCLDLARSLGCDRILFDRDGPKHEALPIVVEGEDEDVFISVEYDGQTITWTWGDQNVAHAAGWFLDETGAIVKDDEGEAFSDDQQAHDHVRAAATAGDERAIRAMILDNLSAADCWLARMLGGEG
jgi:hypothetical protein